MRKFIIAAMFTVTAFNAAAQGKSTGVNYPMIKMEAENCMQGQAQYLRGLNDRSEEAVIYWLIDKCSAELDQFFKKYFTGYTPEMRYKRFHAMATKTLADYPRGK